MVFGRDMIIQIKHTVYWEWIHQRKKMQSNKDNTHTYINRVDHDYKVRYKVMLTKHTTYKHETTYTTPFVITRFFTNGTVDLQCVTKTIRYNIRWIKPYKSNTKVEDISSKYVWRCQNMIASYKLFYWILFLVNKVYNRMSTERLTLNNLGRAVKFLWRHNFVKTGCAFL